MPAALAAIEAAIDEAPEVLALIDQLIAAKKQQYASVLASVQAQTAAQAAALEASK